MKLKEQLCLVTKNNTKELYDFRASCLVEIQLSAEDTRMKVKITESFPGPQPEDDLYPVHQSEDLDFVIGDLKMQLKEQDSQVTL